MGAGGCSIFGQLTRNAVIGLNRCLDPCPVYAMEVAQSIEFCIGSSVKGIACARRAGLASTNPRLYLILCIWRVTRTCIALCPKPPLTLELSLSITQPDEQKRHRLTQQR